MRKAWKSAKVVAITLAVLGFMFVLGMTLFHGFAPYTYLQVVHGVDETTTQRLEELHKEFKGSCEAQKKWGDSANCRSCYDIVQERDDVMQANGIPRKFFRWVCTGL